MINKLLTLLSNDPSRILALILGKFYAFLISKKRGVTTRGKLTINGQPLIDIRNGSTLAIGSGVTLNSRNRGYHINMHSPVKIFVDRAGAKISIGDNTRIHGTCIHAYQLIEIGKNCLIAANCQIFDGNGHDLSFENVAARIYTSGSSKPIRIEDNVWIGANSIILPGVTIGAGSVISANSVVTKDIPSMVVAGGNPAKIIRTYENVAA